MAKPEPKFETISITRVKWDMFEIEVDGVSIILKRGDVVKGCPRAFNHVENLYAISRATHGVSKGKRYN